MRNVLDYSNRKLRVEFDITEKRNITKPPQVNNSGIKGMLRYSVCSTLNYSKYSQPESPQLEVSSFLK